MDLLAVQGTPKSLLQHHSSKASSLWCSAFFIVQLSDPYMTTGKTIALTRWTFVGKAMSLLFNMLPGLVIAFLPRSKLLLILWLQAQSVVPYPVLTVCRCFLTCIQISQEAGQVVWYSHLFQNFPQFAVIHIVKDFDIVNKTEVGVFVELSCFFYEPTDVGNLISAFSKSGLKFMVHILLKPGLENFEHYFASM